MQEGTLVVTNSDALSSSVEVAGGAVLDLDGGSVSISTIKASGCVAGNLTVTGALVAAGDSFLSVEGSLTIAPGAKIDFGGVTPSRESRPIAVASGTVSSPGTVRAQNAGEMNRCILTAVGGILYAQPSISGMMLILR